jgi:hypothetical protein
MENKIIRRQTALNQPPVRVTPEGGYHRGWRVTASSGLANYKSMQEKNARRKELAEQKVCQIVEVWEAQDPMPPRIKGKKKFGNVLSDFSKKVGLGLSYTSLDKRYSLWKHLHD